MAPATPAASSSWSRTDLGFWDALMRAELQPSGPPGRGLADRDHRRRAGRGRWHRPARRRPTLNYWFRSEHFPACANLRAIFAQAARCPGSATEFKKNCFRVSRRRWHRFVRGTEPGAPGSVRSSISRVNPIYCSAIIDCLVAARPAWSEQRGIGDLLQKRNALMKVSANYVPEALPGSGAQMTGDLA